MHPEAEPQENNINHTMPNMPEITTHPASPTASAQKSQHHGETLMSILNWKCATSGRIALTTCTSFPCAQIHTTNTPAHPQAEAHENKINHTMQNAQEKSTQPLSKLTCIHAKIWQNRPCAQTLTTNAQTQWALKLKCSHKRKHIQFRQSTDERTEQ